MQLGPLRSVDGIAEVSGCLSAAGLVIILTVCLSMYGGVSFQDDMPAPPRKTLSGRDLPADELQSSDGYAPMKFSQEKCIAWLITVTVCNRIPIGVWLQVGWLHLWLVHRRSGWCRLGVCLLPVPAILLLDI